MSSNTNLPTRSCCATLLPMERDTRQYNDFEFNMRELAGAMGDFGTLFPLAIGLIAVCHMDPMALFVMIGLTNIVTGLIYRLPMPVEPKKVVSVAAIAQHWTSSMVIASGFGLGLIWLLIAATGILRKLSEATPIYLIRGIQLALGITLAWKALQMMAPEPWLGALAVVIILLLRKNRYAPAAVVIVGLGVALTAWRGELTQQLSFGITLPQFSLPTWSVTNAVLATATMIRELFPQKPVSENRLMLNQGIMNIASSLFGGMPMCHGSGGLAGQYYFGARTGGANIIEGVIEICLGVFLGRSLLGVLMVFPMALIGGMMLMVGIQFVDPVRKLRGLPLALALVTTVVSVVANMGLGFVVGLAGTSLVRWLIRRGVLEGMVGEV